jgi:hydroxycarboxylate dehydrogenase B
MAKTTLFTAAQLEASASRIFTALGSSPQEAQCVAQNLVEANLRGHDSHGVGMVPRYTDAFLEGGVKANATVSTILDTGPLLTVNGNAGYGQVIGRDATNMAIERAKQHGVCLMGLANAHHIGRIGHWAEQAAAAGLVSVHFVNVLALPAVAPWGGRDARHGTNPFCVGVPRPGAAGPIILDFATSRIAQGKVRVAHNKGEKLPLGILLDGQGNPTTDPRWLVADRLGAILPFGEHKGSGLALVCELLGGALAGGLTAHIPNNGRKAVINGMLSIVIDPTKLGTAANLYAELEAFVAWHTASPAMEGTEKVLIAGDPERATREMRLRDGIPVDEATWNEILEAARKAGTNI